MYLLRISTCYIFLKGLFNMRRCFKGRHCNFLHVFRDPDREFFQADRDLPPYTPPSHTPRRHSSHDERRYVYVMLSGRLVPKQSLGKSMVAHAFKAFIKLHDIVYNMLKNLFVTCLGFMFYVSVL